MALLDLFVNAIFTGMGTGVGSYIATRYALRHLENVEERILRRKR